MLQNFLLQLTVCSVKSNEQSWLTGQNMLSVAFSYCYAECHYAECHHAAHDAIGGILQK